MRKRMMIIIVIVFVIAVSGQSFAGESFGDKDLKKYENSPVDKKLDNSKREFKTEEDINYEILLDKYCRKWLILQDDLEKAADELNYVASEYKRIHLSKTYTDMAIDKYKRAVRAVSKIMDEITEVETKAWRKNLPKLSYECDYYDVFD